MAKKKTFTYKFGEGELVFPLIKDIKLKILNKAAGASSVEEYNLILTNEVLDDAGRELLQELTLGELEELWEQWNTASGITAGE